MSKRQRPDAQEQQPAPLQGNVPDSVGRRQVPDYLTIATILAPWGVHGELKVRIETDFPERFAQLTQVYLGAEHESFEIEGLRPYQGNALLKLKGLDTPESAGVWRGADVQIPIAEAWPLPTGQYYVYELEGLEVCTEEGESLGHLTDVLFTGANPILVTQGPRGEI